MKRLSLSAFKAKTLENNPSSSVDQLLGQVLGDCHDGHSGTGSSSGGSSQKLKIFISSTPGNSNTW